MRDLHVRNLETRGRYLLIAVIEGLGTHEHRREAYFLHEMAEETITG